VVGPCLCRSAAAVVDFSVEAVKACCAVSNSLLVFVKGYNIGCGGGLFVEIAHVVGTTVNDFEHRSELRHSKFPRKQVVEQRLICREHRLHLQQGVAQYDVMVESEGAHLVYPHPFGVVSVETCRGRRPYFYKGNVGDCDNAFDAYALRALKPYYVSRVACAVF